MAKAAELGQLIGARVRQSRAERGWTLDELAERSRVSRRMLVNIEQGSTNPSIATLLRISDMPGVGLLPLDTVAGDRRMIDHGHLPTRGGTPLPA